MEQFIPMLPLAHYVTMFEACPHLTWVALLGAVPIAVTTGIFFGRRKMRTLFIIVVTWCAIMFLYFIGVRIYIQSKPAGYWCRKLCIENLKSIEAAKKQWASEHGAEGDSIPRTSEP